MRRVHFLALGLAMTALLYVLARTERGALVVANVTDAALDSLPRGIRNNNPGNIEWISNPAKRWRGMYDSDGRFGIFDTPANGIRAIGKELLLDYSRGVRTIFGLISNWAPSNENNTRAYARAVADYINVREDEPINVRSHLAGIVAGIIRYENGQQPYNLDDIHRWANAA